MTTLDTLIQAAYQSEGATADVNKVYVELLKTTLYVPIEKGSAKSPDSSDEDEAPFIPLFVEDDEKVFIAAFDNLNKLMGWAGDHYADMDYITMVGRDVIAGMSDEIYLAFNPTTEFYKEFSPEEILRLKTMVQKIMQWRQSD